MDNTMDTVHALCDDAIRLKLELEKYYEQVLCLYGNKPQMLEFRDFFHLDKPKQ